MRDQWVLIENQLEQTDHTHLGQIITYAAGLNAVTVIWIARKFVEQHRAALDWLNEITAEGTDFFGVEVELWRIGRVAAVPPSSTSSASRMLGRSRSPRRLVRAASGIETRSSRRFRRTPPLP